MRQTSGWSQIRSGSALALSLITMLLPLIGGEAHAQETPRANASTASVAPVGTPLPAFDTLTATQQLAIRRAVAPPPLGERRNPYSTPMYYPQWGDRSPDGKVHPEWQEALIRDWAELGLTKLHLFLYPEGTGSDKRNFTIDEQTRLGLQEFVRLCKKYNIRIGLRIDPPYSRRDPSELPPGSDPQPDLWPSHPDNPQNELKPFLGWLTEIVTLLRGNVEYMILGDELDLREKRPGGKSWSYETYMRFFKQVVESVHKVDSKVKVSMYATHPRRLEDVKGLMDAGYARYGDAIAINNDNYDVLRKFTSDLKTIAPGKEFPLLSNGVGYIPSDSPDRNPADAKYPKYDDKAQAGLIARNMYTMWSANMGVAPYYVCLRTITYHGKKDILWYGFFGFMDMVIDEQNNATIIRHPGWYAYRTVAQVFHDRPAFKEPTFPVKADNADVTHLKAYERDGKELLVILWSDKTEGTTNIRLGADTYGYPVQISLLNQDQWTAVSATKEKAGEAGTTLWNVPVGKSPTILRLVRPDLTKPGRTAQAETPQTETPTYVVQRTNQAPTIDGKLEEAAWKGVPPTAAFRRNGDGAASPEQTTVRMTWDDKALYLAFACEYSQRPVAKLTAHDAPVWTEENVELLIDAPGKQRKEDMVELLVNPLGTRADLRWQTPDLQKSLQWNAPGVRVATSIGDSGANRRWTAEYAIPFPAIPNAPRTRVRAGDTWRVGIYRKIVSGEEPVYQAWSPTFTPSFQHPERFGTLRFAAANATKN